MIFFWRSFWVPILWSADEHFDEVIVEAVVNLVLQVPLELRMLQIASVDGEHVGVHRNVRVVQIDQYLDGPVVIARRKGEKRVLVAPEMIANLRQVRSVSHLDILLRSRRRGAER